METASTKRKPSILSPDIEIWTEGKTDWRYLQKAHKKLGLDLNIKFQEFDDDMGDQKLLDTCKTFARKRHTGPMLFIFDRDNEYIVKEVNDKYQSYKNWGNNVYSFALPIPTHRVGFKNLCMEFYFADEELKTQDSQGRRLFLTCEFNENSGKHNLDPTINVGHNVVLKGFTEPQKTKIIDSEVYDKSNNNIALSKASFAHNIVNDIEPFCSFDFKEFIQIFEVIDQIIQVSRPRESIYFPDQTNFAAGLQGLDTPQKIDNVFRTLLNILEMTLLLFIATTIRCYGESILSEPERFKKKARPIKNILSEKFREPSLSTLHELGRHCYYLVDSTAPERLVQMKGCLETVMVLGDIGQVIEDLEKLYPPRPGTAIIANKTEISKSINDFVLPEMAKYASKSKGSLHQRIKEAGDAISPDITTWQNALTVLLSKLEPILSNKFVLKTLETVDTHEGTYSISVRTYSGFTSKQSVISIPTEEIEQYESNLSEMLISNDVAVQLFPFLLIKDDSLFFYKRTRASGYEYYSIKKDRVYIHETKRKFNHSVFRTGSRQALFWTEVLPSINPKNGVKANIPTEGLTSFIGRRIQINSIIEEIVEIPNQNGIIYGPGGIGKTALMRQISKELFDTPKNETIAFDNIIWVSAKSDFYDYIFDTVEYKDPQFKSLDHVLWAILEFFSFENLDEYDFEDRKDLALQLLERNKVLLVLDNFECVSSSEADKIIKFLEIEVKRALRTKPDNFKVIITSRKQIPSGFHQIELNGLDLEESKLLMAEIHKRYPSTKPELTDEQKERLHEVTKGIPIVLIHCLARIYERNQPIEVVIASIPRYSSQIVQFSYKEILQEVEKSDSEAVQLQILLLLELMNRPLMIRQIADIMGVNEHVIESRIPTLVDYQCLRRVNQDNQEKFVINENIRLLTRSLAQKHSALVKDIRRKIAHNLSIDQQMDYTTEEREVVEIFENYLAQRECVEAERFIEQQLRKMPDSILINYHYARYLKEEKRDSNKAIEILERIRERSGNHYSILRTLFSCYISLSVPNFDKASVYVEQLESDLGDNEALKLEIADFYIRWSNQIKQTRKLDPLEELQRQSQYKSLASKAIAILKRTKTITPQVYYMFAQGYSNEQNYELALRLINRAIIKASRGGEEYPKSFDSLKWFILKNLESHEKHKH
jgi:GTPase SAR1 family protein